MRRLKRSAAQAIGLLEFLRPRRAAGRYSIAPELMATDRIMRRWAVSIGDGLPSDTWDDQPQSRPPPLDDDTAVIVDRTVNALPAESRRLVILWWKVPESRLSPDDISRRMGWIDTDRVPMDPFPHVNGLLMVLQSLLRDQGVDC
jgi:hypothetical protein